MVPGMSGDRNELTIPAELDGEMTPAVRAFVERLLQRIAVLEARAAPTSSPPFASLRECSGKS